MGREGYGATQGGEGAGGRARARTHLSTTTTGLSLHVINISPFQIMSAEKQIIAKFRIWNNSCRLFAHSRRSASTFSSTESFIELIILSAEHAWVKGLGGF